MSPPRHYPCHPTARYFPSGWKSVWFRRNSTVNQSGVREYACPYCERAFTAHDLDVLQGDHIWPYSLFGPTTWDNYHLICGRCNARKGNWLDEDIRKILSTQAFRKQLIDYIAANNPIIKNPFYEKMLHA